MKTYIYRASNLKSTITCMASVSQRNSISGARQKPSFLANNNNFHNHLLYLDDFSRSILKQSLQHLYHYLTIFLRFVLL